MSTISEHTLETGIVADLVAAGWKERPHAAYDRALCHDPGPLLDFVQATQPQEWRKFCDQQGASARDHLLKRIAQVVEADGTLAVLRQGVKANGCRFRLAAFRPETGFNPETQRLYQANAFTVIRQVRYSEKTGHSLDLVVFLNGLPLFTAELKNLLNGQDVTDAIAQYRGGRDPREPAFALGRCLAHFAVDPDLVYVATHLRGETTLFLPFNRGNGYGAGNPPTAGGFATAYLWRETWKPDSVLDLVQHFAQDVRDRDDQGRLRRTLIFPRYHQLDSVRRLVKHAREHGPGQNYLVQHSAGSGKSNSIAWLAHRLVSLHDDQDRRVFDSIIIVTDRVALDRQLSRTVSSFEQTAGIVEHIDKTSRQLKESLEGGKQVIVTTQQKFPVIVKEIRELAGRQFALIVDEAHSSQGGESSRDVKRTLSVGVPASAGGPQPAKAGTPTDEEEEEEGPLDRALRDQKERGRMKHVSTFAFTATPKPETLELFGTPGPDGKATAFSLYSMRQAIEEGFILDVLRNYLTYRTYWKLLKKIEEDPHYDRAKAARLLKAFVAEHELTVRKQAEVVVEHFLGQVQDRIGGQARAMLVTSSRLLAVRFKREIDELLKERGDPFRTLVAFTGTVKDGEKDYTEPNMNGFPESQTAGKFATDPYRLLIVANKFQTGFDQPLLHTMYVDKKLAGVNAVQTLSRLNRTYPGKEDTCVLDFVNDADEVRAAFERYFYDTRLARPSDPNQLYDLESRLKKPGYFIAADLEAFGAAYYAKRLVLEKVHAALGSVVERYEADEEDERREFRGLVGEFVRVYAFLGQVLTFQDAELERLYQFCRYLLRVLPVPREEQPRELQHYVDLQSVRLVKTGIVRLEAEPGKGVLKPVQARTSFQPPEEQLEPLSEILKLLNERFGTDFKEEDKVFLQTLEKKLAEDPGLAASFAVNTRENARLTFEHKVRDTVQDMIDTNFKFYKQINDKPEFADFLNNLLFDRYAEGKEGAR
jgi:type I restriction enzyme R subunit